MADVNQTAPTPAPKTNPVIKFITDFWNKLEDVDAAINSKVASITAGHSTLAILVACLIYYFVKPFIGVVLSIPALAIKVILDVLSIVVPAVINAIPSIVLVAIGLLVVVELKNIVVKFFKA